MAFSSGGLLGANAVICGGEKIIHTQEIEEYTDNCYIMNPYQKKARFLAKMRQNRANQASAVINGMYLWITGGSKNNLFNILTYQASTIQLSSTEFVDLVGTTQGPELPIPLIGHAMINIENNLTMLIGGNSDGDTIEQTFYYNHTKREWSIGPKLSQKRESLAAGIVIDEVTKNKLVVVAGGNKLVLVGSGDRGLGTSYRSTEILLNGQWATGEKYKKSNRIFETFLMHSLQK